jgi:hypothetical protein
VNLHGTVKIDGSKTSVELPDSGKIYEIEDAPRLARSISRVRRSRRPIHARRSGSG